MDLVAPTSLNQLQLECGRLDIIIDPRVLYLECHILHSGDSELRILQQISYILHTNEII